MARAVFQHELQDPDFSWLISKFQELNPHYSLVDSSFLPLVLIQKGTTEPEPVETEAEADTDIPAENPEIRKVS